MAPASARAFYSGAYYMGGDYSDYVRSESHLKLNFQRFAKRLMRTRRDGRLLEIGCAYGYFLDVAAAYWTVMGIDVSREAVDRARERFGDRVLQGEFLDATDLRPGSFDWIVAWDTLEHVDDPRGYLRRCYELLAPGGAVAFTTGDIGSPVARLSGRRWRLLTPPSHLSFFTRAGIQRLLNDMGFRDVEISTAGYTRSLDFTLFRLLGASVYEHVPASVRDLLAKCGLYVNLFDVMFVVAHKRT